MLGTIIRSYLDQIEYAVRRKDVVSVNRRVAAFLANYFDIVFAVNRVLYPGEKRLVGFAQRECRLLPTAMVTDVAAVLATGGTASQQLVVHLNRLLDRLDDLLTGVGLEPHTW
ncbi:MAG: hypothetical protein M3R24_39705 [Chloroflexota bacterium]|nr:hypothetical protein [Chloroflexota bacterium]